MARGQTVNSGRVSGYYSPSSTAAAALIHPVTVAMGRHESLLTSPLLLPSHHSETHPFDCHRSSFLFCFPLSCVPIQSIFISLLGSFNSCFHCRPDRSIFPCLNPRHSPFQPARRGAPSHFLHLSVTSLLRIPFNLPRFYFPIRLLLPSQDIFFLPLSVIGIFSPVVDVFLSKPSLPLCQLDLLYPSIPAKGRLSGPIKLPSLMSIPTLHSLGPTGQFIWSKGRQGASTR